MDTKNIIIAGGGTAGWLTALFSRKLFPNANITVVESSDIGILGAGEGTTPNIIDFFEQLDIDYKSVIKETNGSLKISIKFENWNGDNEYYYHPFAVSNPHLNECNYGTRFFNVQGSFLTHGMLANEINPGRTTTYCVYSEKNKVPFFVDSANNLKEVGTFALHFDARLLAEYLKKIAKDRNINRIESNIKDIVFDQNKKIKSLVLEDDKLLDLDFIFDCTGFQRLIIGKKFNSPWINYNKFLPVDTALAFFLPSKNDVEPYTTALAMKHGWMWKIPLQHRTGCGYIFDSSYINEKEAQEEIESVLKQKIEPVKTFKFKAGCYEKTWINNCVAIGLSSGFTEPLEATSIMMSIRSLELLKNSLTLSEDLNQDVIDSYNEKIVSMNTHIMEFLYSHYVTHRDDTEFWKKFTWENAPDNLKKTINLWKQRPIDNDDQSLFKIFGQANWLYVLGGNGELEPSVYKKSFEDKQLQSEWNIYFKKYLSTVYDSAKSVFDHRKFLSILGAK